MDERLRDLERAAQSRPSDAEAARRLDRGLARAGEDDALRRRYRLKFRCALSYDELGPSGDPLRRWCARCERSVHFARDEATLREHVVAGRCVAFARRDLPLAYAELAGEEAIHSADEPGAPCVVPSPLPFVDLARIVIPAGVAALVPDDFAERMRVVPFARDDGVLQLAVVELEAESTAEAFAVMLDTPVALHFADRRALDEAIERLYAPRMFLGAAVLDDFYEPIVLPTPPALDPNDDGLDWVEGPRMQADDLGRLG